MIYSRQWCMILQVHYVPSSLMMGWNFRYNHILSSHVDIQLSSDKWISVQNRRSTTQINLLLQNQYHKHPCERLIYFLNYWCYHWFFCGWWSIFFSIILPWLFHFYFFIFEFFDQYPHPYLFTESLNFICFCLFMITHNYLSLLLFLLFLLHLLFFILYFFIFFYSKYFVEELAN